VLKHFQLKGNSAFRSANRQSKNARLIFVMIRSEVSSQSEHAFMRGASAVKQYREGQISGQHGNQTASRTLKV
jgi:hypothetical protein